MGNATMQTVLPRADTPGEIGALILSSETAGICLMRRFEQGTAPTLTLSRDEVHEIADRFFRLAQVARSHHATLTQGRPVVAMEDPVFQPRTWTERVAAWWQAFVRRHLVADAPLTAGEI